MTDGYIQPPTGVDQQRGRKSVPANGLYAAFVVIVTLGTLAGLGLILWLLSLLASSNYGVYFGA
ncbi:MAG: hypothetical protein WA317_00200 [Mycobacterium sp.]|uniref:hypothetical protein n=1 Tax=Mycobacterium sp. TaxID=1785 RepID=UPI003CC659A2